MRKCDGSVCTRDGVAVKVLQRVKVADERLFLVELLAQAQSVGLLRSAKIMTRSLVLSLNFGRSAVKARSEATRAVPVEKALWPEKE